MADTPDNSAKPGSEFERYRSARRIAAKLEGLPPEDLAAIGVVMDALLVATPEDTARMTALIETSTGSVDVSRVVTLAEEILREHGSTAPPPADIDQEMMVALEETWRCAVGTCDGRMEYTGESVTTTAASYKHRCSICARIAWVTDEHFPRIVHKPWPTGGAVADPDV